MFNTPGISMCWLCLLQFLVHISSVNCFMDMQKPNKVLKKIYI